MEGDRGRGRQSHREIKRRIAMGKEAFSRKK